LNTVSFGFDRERRIRAFIIRFPYVPTSVLRRVFFADMKSVEVSNRKCRQVLQRMVEKKLIRRFKQDEYIYYCGEKSRQWFHTHCITMFHFDLYFSLREPQEIFYFKREFIYPGGRADALYILRLNSDGSGIKFFLEWDDEGNEFDKIAKYEAYFKSRAWLGEFWADPLRTGRLAFPVVLVVTEREIRGSEVINVKRSKPGSRYLEVLTGEAGPP
jgi:hypothetical protein